MINNTLDWIIDKERVREAFKDFVHALVWESRDIEEGASEEEINEHIDLYVKTKGDGKINDFRNEYMNFLLEVDKKFKIEVYTVVDCDYVFQTKIGELNLEHCEYTNEYGEAMDITISQLGRDQRIMVRVYLRENSTETLIYTKKNWINT